MWNAGAWVQILTFENYDLGLSFESQYQRVFWEHPGQISEDVQLFNVC